MCAEPIGELTPDEEVAERIALSKRHVPVVGLGASAGGIEALQKFFENTPTDSGMAFVVILHLAPDVESHLANVLQNATRMPVLQVTATLPVEPNKVYVIPPNKYLSMTDGKIGLSELEKQRTKRAPVDIFFRTLAETHGPYGAAVVLSGNGSDGSVGLARIKEYAGVTIAQDPREAQYNPMPLSAINTGLVDYVLPAGEIAGQLISYWKAAGRIDLPPPEGPPRRTSGSGVDEALLHILAILRLHTGNDFGLYKRATLLRRIARRMQVTEMESVGDYLAFLKEHPQEVTALERDLLISVTTFFRDAQPFATLARDVIPSLFRGKYPSDAVRVWVPGCATGEEAYSLAILLREHADTLPQPPSIQIFATDIDEGAIATARNGIYREAISADVSSERLSRFFVKEQAGYRIKKEIRESMLFAVHNVLKDPPFSRLDLISCRNLLIYLNKEAQSQLLQTFHFALLPDGYLFLGTSESTDDLPRLFITINRRDHIFGRLNVAYAGQFSTAVPAPASQGQPVAVRVPVPTQSPPSLADLHRTLLETYGPPSVLVDHNNDIVHLSSNAGIFLVFPPGEPSHNLVRVILPELRTDLRAALYATDKAPGMDARRVRFTFRGAEHVLNLMVFAIDKPENARGIKLVVFDDLGPAGKAAAQEGEDDGPVVKRLQDELNRTHEQLRGVIEQYETSNEELKASNEEMRAINEELRSTSEELETSKEELQAVNEELQTVNQELKYKVEEVTATNNDLQNLLASTDIATIFLDRELQIKRFTPRTQELFNIRPSDINRPLAHVTNKVNYDQLPEDAAQVLQRLSPIEREVQSSEGKSYLMHLLPYRTADDRIDGVVLTFVDITERQHAEQELRRTNAALMKSEEKLRRANEALERSSKARAAELTEANLVLQNEAIEREQAQSIREVLMRELVNAQEDERKRIARELHDELGQLLTGLKFILGTARADTRGNGQAIEEAQTIADTIITRVRDLAANLRPSVLDDLGLLPALHALIEQWTAQTGLKVNFKHTGLDRRFAPDVEIAVYRVVQEALTNAARHAQAKQVSVNILAGDTITVQIEDKGRGFDVEQAMRMGTSHGLTGMRERLRLLGGDLTIESSPGKGTRLIGEVPYLVDS